MGRAGGSEAALELERETVQFKSTALVVDTREILFTHVPAAGLQPSGPLRCLLSPMEKGQVSGSVYAVAQAIRQGAETATKLTETIAQALWNIERLDSVPPIGSKLDWVVEFDAGERSFFQAGKRALVDYLNRANAAASELLEETEPYLADEAKAADARWAQTQLYLLRVELDKIEHALDLLDEQELRFLD